MDSGQVKWPRGLRAEKRCKTTSIMDTERPDGVTRRPGTQYDAARYSSALKSPSREPDDDTVRIRLTEDSEVVVNYVEPSRSCV